MKAGVGPVVRLTPASTVFLLCDVQERFRAGIHKFGSVVGGSKRLAAAAEELKIPLVVTEQYPKGLGHTVDELSAATAYAATSGGGVFEKTMFTMCTPEVNAALSGLQYTDAVIFGIEAHVCVQQTTLDLLEQGVNVHLCCDALSSQQPVDRACGLQRAVRSGAYATTSESVLMELIRGKDHPSFKAISTILKETKDPDPLPGF